MDERERQLLTTALEILHALMGYMEAKEDFRPALKVLQFPKKENLDVGTPGGNEGFVEFSEKEIQQMPKQFKTFYRIDRKTVHLRRQGNSYELRYRANGYNVTACGKTVAIAKARFLEKLRFANPETSEKGLPTTFCGFTRYFFENFRKKKVSEKTYKTDLSRLKVHLEPHFKNTPITKVKPQQCQALIESIAAKGLTKTAQEVQSLLSVIFKAAIVHDLIRKDPTVLLTTVDHVTEHGKALTQDEEKMLFSKGAEYYHQAFALALYTGLRPNELSTARIDGDFILAINSKRKTKRIEYKRIYICQRLRRFLPQDGIFRIPALNRMREKIRELLPEHKLYDLRTTFYTRCDELGVAAPARDHFVGHSGGRLTATYRDLSAQYLLEEGKKLDRW